MRCEKLTAGFTGIGGIVGDEKLVGIAKQVDVTTVKITKIQPGHSFEHGGQTAVFVNNGIAETVTGGIKIGKQAFDVNFRWVAVG